MHRSAKAGYTRLEPRLDNASTYFGPPFAWCSDHITSPQGHDSLPQVKGTMVWQPIIQV